MHSHALASARTVQSLKFDVKRAPHRALRKRVVGAKESHGPLDPLLRLHVPSHFNPALLPRAGQLRRSERGWTWKSFATTWKHAESR